MPPPNLDELRRSVTEGRAVLERSRATLAKVRRMLPDRDGTDAAEHTEAGRSGAQHGLIRQEDGEEAR